MPSMPTADRRKLESGIVAARGAAEAAARAALDVLGVAEERTPGWLDEDDLQLRRELRARARQLGGDGGREAGMPLLVEEVAYEAWHRMLFARFLADNGLLRHPSGATVSLRDCAELAEEEPGADGWDLAARYAGDMLPGLFRADDPAMRVRFAPEGRRALEQILEDLPPSAFTSDDGIGWVYQFWQARKKDEVNKSGRKIGGADLAPVTQLFTEEYMVRFLLENSLGAWWAARRPDSPLLAEWGYLRFDDDGKPAAGGFPGWPERAAEVTVMDPCCGSGHFLVAAFGMLRRMRMEEEGLGAGAAADAVLRDNLFGLELDPRCAQIATFAVALAAWKAGGSPEAHPPRIACSGVSVKGALADWRRIARGDARLLETMERLYELFKDAPTLGSLIDPRRVTEQAGLFRLDWETVADALDCVAAPDPEASIFAQAAEEAARAAALLGRTYTLVPTNVPYLKRGNQDDVLTAYIARYHEDAKADLATAMLDRCLGFCDHCGTVAVVVPQNWLFLSSYKAFRNRLLETTCWNALARLGPGAFEAIGGEVVSVTLVIQSQDAPDLHHGFFGLDASDGQSPEQKAGALRNEAGLVLGQLDQRGNPDSRILLGAPSQSKLLAEFAAGVHGLGTKDSPRFIRCSWEVPVLGTDWSLMQTSVEETQFFGGMSHIVYWQQGQGILHQLGKKGLAILAGGMAHGKPGVLVSQVGSLNCTLYWGGLFEKSAAAVVPSDSTLLPAVWAYCASDEYRMNVRFLDQKVAVTNSTLVKVPFDLERWQKVAAEQYPDGLPEPHSDDPTQWLFKGHPKGSTVPLQVAVARLAGYRWPEQPEADDLAGLADADGILCLPPVLGDQPAAERLRALLARAYGPDWSPALLDSLLAEAGSPGKDLDGWLRSDFWGQHCKLFHNRPFVWHLWDGARDGFAALVNYHKLDRPLLEKLTYHHLGAWIAAQRAAEAGGEAGANARLVAARKLQEKLIAILEGAPPYDVYVRWKPLARQPIGWEPDLNDGVRLNIRPFVTAGVLRGKFSVNWNKDRGANPAGSDVYRWAEEAQRAAGLARPDGSQRLNDLHLPLEAKRAARERTAIAGDAAR